MDDLYREHVIEHFKQPFNFGRLDKPDVTTPAANPSCGDDIIIDLKLDNDQQITEIGWEGRGCALSRASASILSQWAVGKSLSQVQTLSDQEVLEVIKLPALSGSRVKCATLFVRALQNLALDKNFQADSFQEDNSQ